MSLLKVLFRIFSVLSLLGGVVGGAMFIGSGTMAAQGSQSVGAGLALMMSWGTGLTIFVSGLLTSMALWWMGNVHDYLRDISEAE